MPLTENEIQDEFDGALEDAGFAASQVRFFRLDGLNDAHIGAAWFRPHTDIESGDGGFPGDAAQRTEANSDANRNLHRIAVPAQPTDRALFAALVRHELEHARQWDAMLGIFDYHDFIEQDILPEVAGGLDGCGGGLINTIPTEIDCNAAASVYIIRRFSPDEVQTIRNGPKRNLACSLIPPPPPDTLPMRMIAFAYVHQAAVERHAERRGFPVTSIMRTISSDARDMWELLSRGVLGPVADKPEGR